MMKDWAFEGDHFFNQLWFYHPLPMKCCTTFNNFYLLSSVIYLQYFIYIFFPFKNIVRYFILSFFPSGDTAYLKVIGIQQEFTNSKDTCPIGWIWSLTLHSMQLDTRICVHRQTQFEEPWRVHSCWHSELLLNWRLTTLTIFNNKL